MEFKIKKIAVLLAILLMLAVLLSGCTKRAATGAEGAAETGSFSAGIDEFGSAVDSTDAAYNDLTDTGAAETPNEGALG